MWTGHTYNNLINSTHYKNLSNSVSKLETIVTKVDAIITSLSDASGTEIDKIKSDLDKIKGAFNSVKTSAVERMSEMQQRAHYYDEIYDLLKKRCDNNTLMTSVSYSSNAGQKQVFIWVRKYDRYHQTKVYYDKVSWGSDGFIQLPLKYVETEINRQNEDLNSFSEGNDKLVETSNKVKTYTTTHNVLVDGNDIKLSDQIATMQ